MKEYLKIKANHGIIRNIGFIESGIYYTHRDVQNMFNMHTGFGISEVVLEYLLNKDVPKIQVAWNGSTFDFRVLDVFDKGYEHLDGSDNQFIISIANARAINGSEFNPEAHETQETFEVVKI